MDSDWEEPCELGQVRGPETNVTWHAYRQEGCRNHPPRPPTFAAGRWRVPASGGGGSGAGAPTLNVDLETL